MFDRRSLLGKLLGFSLAPKFLGVAGDDLATSFSSFGILSQELAGNISQYTTKLRKLESCYSIIKPEVFLKNLPQMHINSQDKTIINTENEVFGVSIYVDPSGIFTNEVVGEIFVSM